MRRSQVSNVFPHIAEALFGDDAFTKDGVCLKEPVHQFIETLMLNAWSVRLTRVCKKQRKSLEPKKAEAERAWNGLFHSDVNFLD